MQAEFIQEAFVYVLSGQAAFYVNSREEERVTNAIRRVGWRLAGNEPLDPDQWPSTLGPMVNIERLLDEVLPAANRKHPRAVSAPDMISAVDELQAADGRAMIANDIELHGELADKIGSIVQALDGIGFPVYFWNADTGFAGPDGWSGKGACAAGEFRAAMSRIGELSDLPQRCLIVVKDAHGYLLSDNPIYRRALRNLCEDNHLVSDKMARHLFFVQPYMQPHNDIRHCLVKLDFPLPNDQDIDDQISDTEAGSGLPCPADMRDEIVSSLRGLDTANIQKSLAYCVASFVGFVPERVDDAGVKHRLIQTIRGMRSRQLTTGSGLRIIDPDDPELTMSGDMGGFENIRQLAERVLFCRTREAREGGLKSPSGFAIAGPPGTGKTVSGKLFAHQIGVPLCIANIGTLKEGIVGSSERNVAMFLETVRAIGDCCVLFDEWDKQSGGIVGSNTDGNTSSAMLSLILDFASDPRRKAFLIFTMNRLHGPIESLRAGRISRFYYSPLPGDVDREMILALKLTENGAEVPKNLKKIAADNITGGLSGAELAEMANEAITLSAIRSLRTLGKIVKAPTLEELEDARKVVTPVTKLNKEEIDAMENFKGIAVNVSWPKEKATPAAQALGMRRRINTDPSNN